MADQIIIALTTDKRQGVLTVTSGDESGPRTYRLAEPEEVEGVREAMEQIVAFVHKQALRRAANEAQAKLVTDRINGFFSALVEMRNGGAL